MGTDWGRVLSGGVSAQVSLKFLAETPGVADVADAVSQVFAVVHTSVIDRSARMLEELKRRNYVTPTNYLELVKVTGPNTFSLVPHTCPPHPPHPSPPHLPSPSPTPSLPVPRTRLPHTFPPVPHTFPPCPGRPPHTFPPFPHTCPSQPHNFPPHPLYLTVPYTVLPSFLTDPSKEPDVLVPPGHPHCQDNRPSH